MLETREIPKDIKLESVSCDLCGGDALVDWDIARSNNLSKCNDCGLVFTNPRIAASSLKDELIYDDAYFLQKSRMTEKLINARKLSYQKEIDQLEIITGKKGSILDVGCGMGFLLEVMSEKWEKHGCDVSTYALSEAKKKGVKTYQGEFENISFGDSLFDVIYFRASLHHAYSPKKCIEKAYECLNKNGVVAITMSNNRDGICGKLFRGSIKSYEQAHNYLFDTDNLERYLESSGFEIINIQYPYMYSGYGSLNDIMSLPFLYIKYLILKKTGKINMPDNYDFSSPTFYKNYVNIYARRKG
jgi:SAM-dependent methyltransferase